MNTRLRERPLDAARLPRVGRRLVAPARLALPRRVGLVEGADRVAGRQRVVALHARPHVRLVEPEVAPARVAGHGLHRALANHLGGLALLDPPGRLRWRPSGRSGSRAGSSAPDGRRASAAGAWCPSATRPRRTAPAGARLHAPAVGKGASSAMGVASRRLFWQPRDPLRHSASDRRERAHYPVTALVKPEDTDEALERAARDPRVPGRLGHRAARLRRDRRAALRHELVVRLDAPPSGHPALAARQGGPLLRPLLAGEPARGHRRRVRVAVPPPAGQHRRGVDAALPGRLLAIRHAARTRARGAAPGHAPRPRRPLSLGDRPPAADGRRARRSRPAGVR